MNVEFVFLSSIQEITPRQWNALCGEDYPFLDHAFLSSLEISGAVSAASGWQPRHVVIEFGGAPVGVMPLYEKNHSYGEYVFDWAWADAYRRHGFDYYPKLVTAIPFTPATGPRLCLAEGLKTGDILPSLQEAVREELTRIGGSSWHCLFPEKPFSDLLKEQGVSQRLGSQYHWLNQGYRDFADFLDSFSSRKRKNLNKERRRVVEQGLALELKTGREISRDEWRQFYIFYHLTYFKRSGRQGYLNEDFFYQLAESMPDKVVMAIARQGGEMVAASLFFEGSETLYGRYWGCSKEFDFLHFEACYYQGIEYAIRKGLKRFDPGAQGEHKIQRGFTPVATWSNHWIDHPDFRMAIDDFMQREKVAMEEYMEEAKGWLPFKEM
ncbi:N-acetyltransferase [Proteobacteria bacterium 005FR1]|nr:N-acetyltransferase [Proteobacteria bacterium 005FR1]